jgi:hypothetical protein
MNSNWRSQEPNLSVTPKNLMNQRDNAKTGLKSLDFNRSIYADDAAFVFLSTFFTTESARFGLTLHLGTNEPARVTSTSEATHIPVQGTTADPSSTEDYDVVDNGHFIPSCDSFRYPGTQLKPDRGDLSH